jgi:hypothetical protein
MTFKQLNSKLLKEHLIPNSINGWRRAFDGEKREKTEERTLE